MILAVDVGNSHTVVGLYRAKRLIKKYRIPSSRAALKKIFGKWKSPVSGMIVSSVVPALDSALSAAGRKLTGHTPVFVTSRLKMPLRIRLQQRDQIGADRLVNAAAAFHRWKTDLIVIDLGTATTFDVVFRDGSYRGGAIVPGLKTLASSLSEKCAKLPRVPLKKPKTPIGRTTIEAIQSGLFFGYAGLIDGMVASLKKKMARRALVVATGGLASLIFPLTLSIDRVDSDLTLSGLKLIYDWNSPEAKRTK